MPFKKKNILLQLVKNYTMERNGKTCDITTHDNISLFFNITGTSWEEDNSLFIFPVNGNTPLEDTISCTVPTNCPLLILDVITQAQDIISRNLLVSIIERLLLLRNLNDEHATKTLAALNEQLCHIQLTDNTVPFAFWNHTIKMSKSKTVQQIRSLQACTPRSLHCMHTLLFYIENLLKL